MTDEQPIYLDYAATTPVDDAVAAAMAGYLGRDGVYANASSLMHEPGRRAAAAVDAARSALAGLLGAQPAELVFTSGATEADNLAILGAARHFADRGRHLVTTRIEHKAVLDAARRLEREGFEVTWLEPDGEGRIDPAAVAAALRDDTLLTSVMWVNNETGVVNDVEAIGRACRERGVLLHVDAAQAVGKLPVDLASLPVDFLALTAHKFYGPKGIGALYVADRPGVQLQPLFYGGGQERGLRRCTRSSGWAPPRRGRRRNWRRNAGGSRPCGSVSPPGSPPWRTSWSTAPGPSASRASST